MFTAVEAKVRSLKDQSLWTGVHHYELIAGEVFVGVFKSVQTLQGFLDIGIIEGVDESVPCEKVFPVVPLNESDPISLKTELGEELPLSDWIEDKK